MAKLSPIRLLILALLLCFVLTLAVAAVLLASIGIDALKTALPIMALVPPMLTGLFSIYRAVERAEIQNERRHQQTMTQLYKVERQAEATLERADEAVSYHKEELR